MPDAEEPPPTPPREGGKKKATATLSEAELETAVSHGARYYGSACFSRSIVHGIFVIPERMVNLMVIDSAALVSKS